jgi:threonine/homoserine/homoserine lactone efflux protein
LILALVVGLLLSFVGSMPIAGPIAAIVVSKGLENKTRAGLCIAGGAAVAESAYAFMAFWGITSVLNRFPGILRASRILGCAILVALGLYFFFRKRKEAVRPEDPIERVGYKNVLFGFSVTAANPTLIVTWTAAVSAAHSTGILRVRAFDAFPFAAGVVTGIVSWFAILLWLLSHFRTKVNPRTIDRAIRVMGILLVVLGVAFAIRVIGAWHAAS